MAPSPMNPTRFVIIRPRSKKKNGDRMETHDRRLHQVALNRQPESIFFRKTFIRRRSDPSITRSPTRTITPPRISGSSR
jgi:hypothetical protein